MAKPSMTVNVHVNPDVPIAVTDGTRQTHAYTTVDIGEGLNAAFIFLSSHDDAVRLVKAAEEAASILLAAETPRRSAA